MKNFGNVTFPLKSLLLLADMLQKDDRTSRMKQILLIHITKAVNTVDESVYFFRKINTLGYYEVQPILWRKLAVKTMNHPQVKLFVERNKLPQILYQ